MLSEPSVVTPTCRYAPPERRRTSSGPPESPRLMVDLDLDALRAVVSARSTAVGSRTRRYPGRHLVEHHLAAGSQAGRHHLANRRGVGAAPPRGHAAVADPRLDDGQLDRGAGLRGGEPHDRDVVTVVNTQIEGLRHGVGPACRSAGVWPVRDVGPHDRHDPALGDRPDAVRSGQDHVGLDERATATGTVRRAGQAQRHHERVGADTRSSPRWMASSG